MDDGQKTPRGHPNFNSYLKNLRVLVFWMDGRMDGWTDRQTDFNFYVHLPSHSTQESYPAVYVELISPVWASLTTVLQVKKSYLLGAWLAMIIGQDIIWMWIT